MGPLFIPTPWWWWRWLGGRKRKADARCRVRIRRSSAEGSAAARCDVEVIYCSLAAIKGRGAPQVAQHIHLVTHTSCLCWRWRCPNVARVAGASESRSLHEHSQCACSSRRDGSPRCHSTSHVNSMANCDDVVVTGDDRTDEPAGHRRG